MLAAQEMLQDTDASEAPVLESLDDFSSWKLDFIAFLQMKGLSHHLRKEDCHRHAASQACNAECAHTMNLLQSSLSDKIRTACASARSTSALWEVLQQLGKSASNGKLQCFVRLLSTAHSVTSETLCDFILTIEAQFAEIEQTGVILDVDFKKAFLFTHLPDDFGAFKLGNWYSNSAWYDLLAELRAYNRDTLPSRARAVALPAPTLIVAGLECDSESYQAVAYCDRCSFYGHANDPCLLEARFGPMGSMSVCHYLHTHSIVPQPHLQAMYQSWLQGNGVPESRSQDERQGEEIKIRVSRSRTAQYRTIELTLPTETQKECPPAEDKTNEVGARDKPQQECPPAESKPIEAVALTGSKKECPLAENKTEVTALAKAQQKCSLAEDKAKEAVPADEPQQKCLPAEDKTKRTAALVETKECSPVEDETKEAVAPAETKEAVMLDEPQKIQSRISEVTAKLDVVAVSSAPVDNQESHQEEAILVVTGPGRDPSDTPTLKAALGSSDNEQWEKAVSSEFLQLVKQGALEIVPLEQAPAKVKSVQFRLLKQRGADDSVTEYKASLCVRYKASKAEKYGRPSRPEAKHRTLLTLLHVAAHLDREVHHISVSSVINRDVLNEPMWLTLPRVLKPLVSPNHFCQVKRAPFHPQRVSYQSWVLLRNALLGLGWKQSAEDQCLFIRESQHGNEMLLVCGDDLVLVSSLSGMSVIKTELRKHCNFRDYGEIQFLLDIHVKRDRSKRKFTLNQETLIKRYVAKYSQPPDLERRLSSEAYQEELACLMHVIQHTRPSLSFVGKKLMQMERERGSAQAKELVSAWRTLSESSNMSLRIDASTPLEIFTYALLYPTTEGSEKGTVMSNCTALNSSYISWTMYESIDLTSCASEEKYVKMVIPSKHAVWLQTLCAELVLDGRHCR